MISQVNTLNPVMLTRVIRAPYRIPKNESCINNNELSGRPNLRDEQRTCVFITTEAKLNPTLSIYNVKHLTIVDLKM